MVGNLLCRTHVVANVPFLEGVMLLTCYMSRRTRPNYFSWSRFGDRPGSFWKTLWFSSQAVWSEQALHSPPRTVQLGAIESTTGATWHPRGEGREPVEF